MIMKCGTHSRHHQAGDTRLDIHATFVYFLAMKPRIRELLHATPFQPFVIRMADGREYRVEHPDFVLAAASDVPHITIEEADGRQHYLSALLVTSIERASDVRSGNGQEK